MLISVGLKVKNKLKVFFIKGDTYLEKNNLKNRYFFLSVYTEPLIINGVFSRSKILLFQFILPL